MQEKVGFTSRDLVGNIKLYISCNAGTILFDSIHTEFPFKCLLRTDAIVDIKFSPVVGNV